MPVTRVHKLDAARVQLEAAAAAFLAGNFIPAITLAAAAEEVLARMLPTGSPSSQDELVALMVDGLSITPKEARDQFLNGVRNALKHHSETETPYIEFDPEIDAKVWIVRGMYNYLKLDSNLPPAVLAFVHRYESRTK